MGTLVTKSDNLRAKYDGGKDSGWSGDKRWGIDWKDVYDTLRGEALRDEIVGLSSDFHQIIEGIGFMGEFLTPDFEAFSEFTEIRIELPLEIEEIFGALANSLSESC